jgi:hypothetical protein
LFTNFIELIGQHEMKVLSGNIILGGCSVLAFQATHPYHANSRLLYGISMQRPGSIVLSYPNVAALSHPRNQVLITPPHNSLSLITGDGIPNLMQNSSYQRGEALIQ